MLAEWRSKEIMDGLVQRLKIVLDKITAARARLIASAKVSTIYI